MAAKTTVNGPEDHLWRGTICGVTEPTDSAEDMTSVRPARTQCSRVGKAPPIDTFTGENSDTLWETGCRHLNELYTGMGGVKKKDCCCWLGT